VGNSVVNGSEIKREDARSIELSNGSWKKPSDFCQDTKEVRVKVARGVASNIAYR
jgi:hypothetical protein